MQRAKIMVNTRLALQVERYHTWPVLRRQSVGEHTAQMLRIWYLIFGPLMPYESSYIIWHDAGELWSGDAPFPVKVRNPDFKEASDRVETQGLEAMLGHNPLVGVTPTTKVRVKICDLLEMFEYGITECRMGNQFAEPIVRDARAVAFDLSVSLPEADRVKVADYINRLELDNAEVMRCALFKQEM